MENPTASGEEQRFDNPAELTYCATRFVSASRRYLDLAAGDPELPAYADKEFVEAVKQVVLGSPHSRVRILLIDPRSLVLSGHPLIELALRLTSHMEIRVLPPDQQGVTQGLLIGDRRHSLQRMDPRRCTGSAWPNAPRRAMKLLEEFETLWVTGEVDPNFRRLML
ncbi:hypothetical protein [Methylococcus sp. EFPC2]|uniref:DUF7931 domain-containing protein n=1 Tax=Methylococcus sp. EFPC2 TaxID=2812648 RepID=UPI00196776A7|nr:hypothetical protein [Methylococcus sp. EFPC2]QSA97224.1 hypothetical protein JWZ97_18890 [Methylococcus sp. EFPC2]